MRWPLLGSPAEGSPHWEEEADEKRCFSLPLDIIVSAFDGWNYILHLSAKDSGEEGRKEPGFEPLCH